MNNKYNEIFEQKLDETDGDVLTKFRAASHALRLAIIKDLPVWMKFNYTSWMIPKDVADEDIDWKQVNELVKAESEYDFNAFDYIDSKEKFCDASANSKIATIKGFNQPFVKRVCKDCGNTYTLTIGQVKFYCKHEYPLQKRCTKCLEIKKGKKDSIDKNNKYINKKKMGAPYPERTSSTNTQNLINGFADALKRAGAELTNNESK